MTKTKLNKTRNIPDSLNTTRLGGGRGQGYIRSAFNLPKVQTNVRKKLDQVAYTAYNHNKAYHGIYTSNW